MLRLLSYLYFIIALVEVALVPLGKWDFTVGLIAAATSLFFGAVLFGLGTIVDEIRALHANRDDNAS